MKVVCMVLLWFFVGGSVWGVFCMWVLVYVVLGVVDVEFVGWGD